MTPNKFALSQLYQYTNYICRAMSTSIICQLVLLLFRKAQYLNENQPICHIDGGLYIQISDGSFTFRNTSRFLNEQKHV